MIGCWKHPLVRIKVSGLPRHSHILHQLPEDAEILSY